MSQPLYPYTMMQPADLSTGGNLITPGTMIIVPFTLNEGGSIIFSLVHAALAEDFSLKAWFSSTPNNQAIGKPQPGCYFSMLRLPYEIVVYDPSIPPPAPLSPTVNQSFFQIEPGTVYLNILNLINHHNIFTFAMNVIS